MSSERLSILPVRTEVEKRTSGSPVIQLQPSSRLKKDSDASLDSDPNGPGTSVT